ncbi:DUF262 domain-containing protein [Kushneria phyllosphaerae]|uniref:GmrSD restriction endonucleases N-terminal domain-containing protein n=1 Tax=Kushneria phyllosphaerae TaxID=2100822 RepID=A0A2R8CKZ8_9GAMM|nr:DUF262 domain-containing protein [Kushneria phyllosphaerae]SPJ33454.1 hypothetical protein KSP9073_01463 [Kushneria phyllosphaerae]
MQINIGQVSLVDYLGMLEREEVIVNRDYQRQKGVWPHSARSYFIDTLLEGYPIPKIYWYQRLSEKTKRPIKELVDGQQRTFTIQDFCNDKFALNSASQNYKGKKFSDLPEDVQMNLMSYQVEYSTILSATRSELLEMFRRMNSYTAPLKEAEKRHSIYQGAFKWFVVELADLYSPMLIDYGVLTDKVVARMGDSEYIADLIIVLENGIVNRAVGQFNNLYRKYNNDSEGFDGEDYFSEVLQKILNEIRDNLGDLVGTNMMRPYMVHSIFSAYASVWYGFPASEEDFNVAPDINFKVDYSKTLPKLLELSDALEDEDSDSDSEYHKFVQACSYSTTKRPQRKTRTSFIINALKGQ